jgi:hypothetical protein
MTTLKASVSKSQYMVSRFIFRMQKGFQFHFWLYSGLTRETQVQINLLNLD